MENKFFLEPTYFTDYETDTLALNIKYSRREVIQRCYDEIKKNLSDQIIDRVYKSYVRPYDEELDETDEFIFVSCSENDKGAFKVWRCDLKFKEE